MLKTSKTKIHGIKGDPKTPRPPKPPSQQINKQLKYKDVVKMTELERLKSELDFMNEVAFEQEQEIKQLREALLQVVSMATSGNVYYDWRIYESILLQFDDFKYDEKANEYKDVRVYSKRNRK
jgi:Asp-tRNA(Asn)/Glu-tRNA(Gln) amidotransferase A subunit family amidase